MNLRSRTCRKDRKSGLVHSVPPPFLGLSEIPLSSDKFSEGLLMRHAAPTGRTCTVTLPLRLSLCAAALLFSAHAQPRLDPAKPLTQFRHDVWKTEDGLPQNTIAAIAQTPDGYLWLGAEPGLVRFDGLR